jgi:hypothetical protein
LLCIFGKAWLGIKGRDRVEKGKKIKSGETHCPARSLPFRGVMAGESRAGVESVGEFSFSSLKLKLLL